MGFENSEQLRELFLSAGMGFCLGAYYDVFRIIRRWLRPSAWRVFFQDCLYAVTAALFTFLFTIALNGGELRTYVLFGLSLGFFAYRRTVGRMAVKVTETVLRGCEKVGGIVHKTLSMWFHNVSEKAKGAFLSIFPAKRQKKFQKGLETQRETVV